MTTPNGAVGDQVEGVVLAWFRVEPERPGWRVYVCRECGWEWPATTLATTRDVAPRLERHRIEQHGLAQP
jgi:hypothetical protein